MIRYSLTAALFSLTLVAPAFAQTQAMPALPAIPGVPSLESAPVPVPVVTPLVGSTAAKTTAPATAAEKKATPGTSAMETVQNFYRAYLNAKPGQPVPDIAKSKAFQDAIDENKRMCKQYGGSDVCGWGADNDVYLNSQERDPKLTFQNSGIRFIESEPNHIEVVLNVYPSQLRSAPYYTRHIYFILIQENGQWVVDDMRDDIGGPYGRAQMQTENSTLVPSTKNNGRSR